MKENQTMKEGRIFIYTHHDGHMIAWIEVMCQTDFAARTELFVKFGHALAMQLASMSVWEEIEDLPDAGFLKSFLGSEWVVESTRGSTEERLQSVATELGEKIEIGRYNFINFGE